MSEDIIERQGWNDATLISLFWRYLEMTDQLALFQEFLQRVANDENEDA